MYYLRGGSDRRKFQRLSLNIIVRYKVDSPVFVRIKFGDKEYDATTLDVSEGGMAFLTALDIPSMSMLLIKFTLTRIDRSGVISYLGPVEFVAEVRSNVPWENQEHRLGVSFLRKNSPAAGGDDLSSFLKATS